MREAKQKTPQHTSKSTHKESMKTFLEYIAEAYADGKNTHMTHIDDLVLYGGVKGIRNAIMMLRSLRDTLAGNSSSPIDRTVKWDGAPAIFVGEDPADGEFFIAKKGLFAKNPKVYKSEADIMADTSGDLAVKLKTAFNELKGTGIVNIIQGDLMFTQSDLKTETIDGEPHVTFQPNTIVYAVPTDSDLGRTISKAKVGVVFHTSYTGPSLTDMQASYNVDLSKIMQKPTVWMQDASYHDLSGTATFTKKDSDEITKILSKAGKTFQSISGSVIRDLESDPALARLIEQYNNTLVRKGERIGNTKAHVKNLIAWFNARFDKELDKRSSARGKAAVSARRKETMAFFSKSRVAELDKLFQLQNAIVDAKMYIVDKMNEIQQTKTFVRLQDGTFKVTEPEGYVAIDHTGNAVKLVDRLNFSYLNFSPDIQKGWS
jgi:hypothetical protein